jgi:hypothetical protein
MRQPEPPPGGVTPLAHEIRGLVSDGNLDSVAWLLPRERARAYPAGNDLPAHLRP